MSILAFLKKFKLPRFEDDFIQDPIEKSTDGASIYNAEQTHQHFEIDAEADNDWDERCRVIQRHHDPSDPMSLSCLDLWGDQK